NARKIYGFLEKEGLPVTKKNLEYAFQELNSEFVRPAVLPPPPVPPVTPSVREVPPPPVAIPANFGERVEVPANGGMDAAEMQRSATLPPAEMKSRIEAMFRRQMGR